jgi:hypothetical protein
MLVLTALEEKTVEGESEVADCTLSFRFVFSFRALR